MARETIIPIHMLRGSSECSEFRSYSIFIVSDGLHNGKEKAYTPKVVSIGALTNGTGRYPQLVEQVKLRYMRSLLGRKRMPEEHDSIIENCILSMRELDGIVQKCYGSGINFNFQDLANIMFLDGCFVLEFLHRFRSYGQENSRQVDNSDPIFMNIEKLNSVLNDLTILENQIPFVVLKILLRGIFPSDLTLKDDHRVVDLALSALRYDQAIQVPRSGIAHLLHLIHLSNVDPEENEWKAARQELTRSATTLQEVGVSIEAACSNPDDNRGLLNKFDFNITFDSGNGILIIPPLHIKETTETIWRNLIAWEQGNIDINCKFTSYALFFHGLICSEQDIELLRKSNVIVNSLGISHKDLLTMFRTIADRVERMDLSYSGYCKCLNTYRANRFKKLLRIMWNKCKFIVGGAIRYPWRRYSSLPVLWKVVLPLITVASFALTIAQTYFGVQGHNNTRPPWK